MKNVIKTFIKTKPRLYDVVTRVCQFLFLRKDDTYEFFDNFSKAHGRRVTFLQVGASDGLRWDPIRSFIVRDAWDGILVEPLPSVFDLLQSNYRYVKKSKLVFVNAAVSSLGAETLSFWTFDDTFLSKLSLEERVIYSQKSSFSKEHVLRWIRLNKHPEGILREIRVPCFTLGEIVRRYWDGHPIELLVIDAEGHEASIIEGIDFESINPEAIYFESHNLAAKKKDVYDFLSQNNYKVIEIGGDSVALRNASDLADRLQLKPRTAARC